VVEPDGKPRVIITNAACVPGAIAHLEPRKDCILLAVRGVAPQLWVSVHRTPAFRAWIGLAG